MPNEPKVEKPNRLNQSSDSGDACVVAGCSGELCVKAGEDVASICVWKEEFACYKQSFAKCELQSDGKCGWTPNEELTRCINNTSMSIE
jgi:eight-cysteine-cluster-containing protein